MTTTQIVILVLVLLVVAAAVVALMAQAKKRKHLQSRFGSEYDRTVESSGGRRDAERELAEREERRRSLDIRPLPETDRVMYAERWRSTQADFVDRPEQAVRQADTLVTEVMGRRGYPVGDFEQMSRDVSVDHADTVHEYRAAHEISDLNDRKQASTEQLRQAMVHYRALFNDLLASDRSSDDDGVRDERAHDDRARDDRTHDDRVGPDDRVHDDRVGRDDRVHDDRVGRDDRVHDDRVHDDRVGRDDRVHDDRVRHDGTGRDATSDRGYATDEDRRFEPVDSSRAEGVRVERGGLVRDPDVTASGQDLPRDERPRA